MLAVEWKLVKKAFAFMERSKRYSVYLEEKLKIVTFPEWGKLLNKGPEVASKCKQENKFLFWHPPYES